MAGMEHLTREQLVGLLGRAREKSARDWTLILVSFWHGLRASEAVSLTPRNFRDGFIEVARLKGSMRTVQPLVENPNPLLDERAAVDGWLARHKALHAGNGDGSRLFPISRSQFHRVMRTHGAAAGLPRHLLHPHVLKHSIAMQSIATAGIENVRQYLGHRSISSTGRYLNVDDAAASRAVLGAFK